MNLSKIEKKNIMNIIYKYNFLFIHNRIKLIFFYFIKFKWENFY